MLHGAILIIFFFVFALSRFLDLFGGGTAVVVIIAGCLVLVSLILFIIALVFLDNVDLAMIFRVVHENIGKLFI